MPCRRRSRLALPALALLFLVVCALPPLMSSLSLSAIITPFYLSNSNALDRAFISRKAGVGTILTVTGYGMTQVRQGTERETRAHTPQGPKPGQAAPDAAHRESSTLTVPRVCCLTVQVDFATIRQVNQMFTLNGLDFSNNSLTTFDKLNYENCDWCQLPTTKFIYLDLSSNDLDGSGTAIFGDGSTEAPMYAGVTCDPRPQAPGPGIPGHNALCPFTYWVRNTLRYLDLSDNPRLQALPPLFGSAANWFGGTMDENYLPTFRCAGCGLTGVTNGTFQQRFSVVDLAENDFSDVTRMNWDFTFNSGGFAVMTTLNLSHCGLTQIPGINVILQAAPGQSTKAAAYTAQLDFSYNNFASTVEGTSTQNPLVNFQGLTWAGTVNLSHSGMRQLRPYMFAQSRIGTIDLSWNAFGAELNAQGLTAAVTTVATDNSVVPTGATGNIYLNDAGLTQINATMMVQVQAYRLDLSGNSFPYGSSLSGAFDGMDVTILTLNRCNMTSATLVGAPSVPFINAGIAQLNMRNDAGGDDGVGNQQRFNRFDPLPSEWLTDTNTKFASTLESLTVGEVVSIVPAFFHYVDAATSKSTSWINSASAVLDITLQMQSGVAVLAEGGPIFNLLTGYLGKADFSPRATFALTIAGESFLDVEINATAPITSDPRDIFEPSSLTMPLDPAFLHPEMFARFPTIPSVTYTQPTSYYRDVSDPPWAASLSSASVPSDLLRYASGVVSFAISMDPSVTYSPVTALPADLFQTVIPFSGFGALTNVDLAYANLVAYPQSLFSGLYRPSTTITVNMTTLYTGDTPIPPGLFDDVPVTGTVAGPTTISAQAKLNKARNCGYLVNQVCLSCPAGSYLNSKSGYYYCSLCSAGNYCNGGLSLPCKLGSYQPAKNSSQCELCAPGQTTHG